MHRQSTQHSRPFPSTSPSLSIPLNSPPSFPFPFPFNPPFGLHYKHVSAANGHG